MITHYILKQVRNTHASDYTNYVKTDTKMVLIDNIAEAHKFNSINEIEIFLNEFNKEDILFEVSTLVR